MSKMFDRKIERDPVEKREEKKFPHVREQRL